MAVSGMVIENVLSVVLTDSFSDGRKTGFDCSANVFCLLMFVVKS